MYFNKNLLRHSFGSVVVHRRGTKLAKPIHLRGRLLFRSAVRLVIEYKDWINFEIDDDPATRDEEESLRARRDKKRKKIVVKKELSLKDRSKLLIEPSERSQDDRMYLCRVLQEISAFHKYPKPLRSSLAEVCRYQYVAPGRVIVKQDDEAVCLYYIVKGVISMTKSVIDDVFGDKKDIDSGTLSTGNMFGEVALLHYLPRSATVTTKTAVELLYIAKPDFDHILRDFLQEEWNVLADAVVSFDYFKGWSEEKKRECCVLSKLKDFQADDVILGDGQGMANYTHFVVDGECKLIEHLLMEARERDGKTSYRLFSQRSDDFQFGSLSLDSHDTILDSFAPKEVEVSEPSTLSVPSKSSSALSVERRASFTTVSTELDDWLLKRKVKSDRREDDSSIVTTTLQEVVNQWHELTDVAVMLLRRPSVSTLINYPPHIHTTFMQICKFYRGACFGLGENMYNRRIIATTPVRCLLVPRYFLLKNNRANIWERVRLFLDSKYPKPDELFHEFLNNRRWAKYKNELVDEILSKSGGTHCDTTIHDAPYSLRIQAENSNV